MRSTVASVGRPVEIVAGVSILSVDHLVSAQEEISTDRQSKRSRCFEIDDKLEFGGLLNRQVGRLNPRIM